MPRLRCVNRGISAACWVLCLFTAVAVPILVTACGSTATTLAYEDPETGLALDYPRNWSVHRSERFLSYGLRPRKSLFTRGSAYVVIVPMGMLSADETVEDAVEQDIQRLNQFFHLDQLERTALADLSADPGYQTAGVSISVPTTSVPDDSGMNQMGRSDPNVCQTIDVYAIRNPAGRHLVVEVFDGENQDLNAQADEIVNSIRLNAPTMP